MDEPSSEPEPEENPSDDDEEDGFSRARRIFFGGLLSASIGGAAYALRSAGRPRARLTLRPPGALPEGEFESACVRCFRCGNACPNQCIEFHGVGEGLDKVFTPYIHARGRGCVLCGECATACPTGAIQPFEDNEESWLEHVHMGTARVNQDLCYSYNGRTCGACYRSCPLAGRAMTLGLYETPIVHREYCVGCGLCEQSCLHLPQAIRVIPDRGRG